VPPAEGAAVVARLRRTAPCEALYDWGGGLVWLCLDSDDVAAELVRAAIEPAGGHATLIRASVERRAAVPVFQPQPPALAALTRRVKDSFDPKGILNPGRMYAGV
jgi:glycolate oxidase FAD binding subunit